MDQEHQKTNQYAIYLTVIAGIGVAGAMIAVQFKYFTPDDAKLIMTALSTMTSVITLSCLIITTNNQQRNKDSGTSIKSNGNTRSTETDQEPNSRQFNHQRNQKHCKHTATKKKQ